MKITLTLEQEKALEILTAFMKDYTSQDNMGTKLPTLTYVQEFREVPIPMSDVVADQVETTWCEPDAWISTGFHFDGDNVDAIDFVIGALEDADDAGHRLFDNNIYSQMRTRETLTLEHAIQLLTNAVDVNCYDGMLSSWASVHVPILTNPHFTTESCRKFITANQHNLKGDSQDKCITVLDYVGRNYEMEALLKVISTLTGIPLESTYKKKED